MFIVNIWGLREIAEGKTARGNQPSARKKDQSCFAKSATSYDPTMCKIHSKTKYICRVICSVVDVVLQFVQVLHYNVLYEDLVEFDRLPQ